MVNAGCPQLVFIHFMHYIFDIPHFSEDAQGSRMTRKMTSKFWILFVLSLSFVSLPAQAGPMSNLEKQVLEAQKRCPRLNCPDSAVQVLQLSRSELTALGKASRARMKTLVVELARNLWPDTILEGPYEHANIFRTDSIQKLLIHDRLAGYRVAYSDKAWDLDTCDYLPETPETLRSCDTGRIYEAAFLDKELREVFRDEEALAEFRADPRAKN